MSTLLVSTTTDYSTTSLSDITQIKFTSPGVTATFDISQFDVGPPAQINPDVIWVGNGSGPVHIELASSSAAVFDGRQFQFSNFGDAGNTITFLGSTAADEFHGSSKSDIIRGRGGDDWIFSSSGGDELNGGSGNDTFWYVEPDVVVSDVISGNQGKADRIVLFNTGTYDFLQASISGVEELVFETPSVAIMDAGQVGGTGRIQSVDGSGGTSNLTVRSGGADVSLTGVRFSNWNSTSVIRVEGTAAAESLTGSARRDVFIGGGGADQMFGRGGNDVFEVQSVVESAIDGGAGNDRLLCAGTICQFTAAPIVDVESLDLGEAQAAVILADSVGTGGLRRGITTIIGNDQDNTVEVQGSYIDLTDVTLENWDEAADTFALRGTSGTDLIVGSAYADRLHVTGGGDDCSLGGGDDVFVISDHLAAGTILEGSDGEDTLLILKATTTDLTGATLGGIERLTFGLEGQRIVLLPGQVGGGLGIQTVDANGTQGSIDVTGQVIDLSVLTILNKTQGDFATLRGTDDADTMIGTAFGDNFFGSLGADVITGGDGTDDLSYAFSSDAVEVSLQAGTATGGDAEGDIITGIEQLSGSAFDDRLTGDGSDNYIDGNDGNDRIVGHAGTDFLRGGLGNDVFIFTSTSHSGLGGQADVIGDFSSLPLMAEQDRIRLDSIDAQESSSGSDEAFVFIGTGAFTAEGQIRVEADGGDTLIKINTSGSGGAEMTIRIENYAPGDITADDFIL